MSTARAAIALEHRTQGDARPQFCRHQIHAADLAVQKQRGGGRDMGKLALVAQDKAHVAQPFQKIALAEIEGGGNPPICNGLHV